MAKHTLGHESVAVFVLWNAVWAHTLNVTDSSLLEKSLKYEKLNRNESIAGTKKSNITP